MWKLMAKWYPAALHREKLYMQIHIKVLVYRLKQVQTFWVNGRRRLNIYPHDLAPDRSTDGWMVRAESEG